MNKNIYWWGFVVDAEAFCLIMTKKQLNMTLDTGTI